MIWNSDKKIKWLSKKIKQNWGELSDEEISSYQETPDAFYQAVQKKYGMFKDDIESSVQHLKSGYGFFGW
jgi:uncharacterized protein YjbJ (UPF0337 family)